MVNWTVRVDSNGREIEWDAGTNGEHLARKWYRDIKRTKQTIDTQSPVFAAQLLRDGQCIASWSA